MKLRLTIARIGKEATGILKQAFANSAFRAEMLDLVDKVFSTKYDSLAELSKASMMALICYFDLKSSRRL